VCRPAGGGICARSAHRRGATRRRTNPDMHQQRVRRMHTRSV